MASIYYPNPVIPAGYKPSRDTGVEPILLAGDNEALNSAFAEACATRGIFLIELPGVRAEAYHEAALKKAIDKYKPWAIITTPGYLKMENLAKERFCYVNIDPHGIPSYMYKLVRVCLGFLADERTGIWNLSNESLIMQAGGAVDKYIHF
jgi:dTDP-4-dehydrorhamnose reductase